MTDLVLSLFPGVDLLGLAFELEGYCVVTGPEVMFGRDVRAFHPPAGRFDGVIGGPPCQAFSQANVMGRLGRQHLAENLIPEFERVVGEAQPDWFLMENVCAAPLPSVGGYIVKDTILNNRWLGKARRARRMSDTRARSRSDRSARMLASYIRWQELPEDFLADAPFTLAGKVRVVGNGVPIPMGRAIARAVRRATQ